MSSGPAGKWCDNCKPSYVKLQRGILFHSEQKTYVVKAKRSGQQFHKLFNSFEDALQYWNSLPKKQDISGDNSPWVKSKGKSAMFNHRKLNYKLRQNSTFICTNCGELKDIKFLCVHHIDHDRSNDSFDNFKVLCKKCHQDHHVIRDQLGRFSNQSSETIPQGSTLK